MEKEIERILSPIMAGDRMKGWGPGFGRVREDFAEQIRQSASLCRRANSSSIRFKGLFQ